jgi:hypothetical protein
MTAHHRPILVFLVALMLPACMCYIDPSHNPPSDPAAKSDPNQKSDPPRKTQFAELLSHPGSIVFTRPNAKEPPAPQPADSNSESGVVVVAVDRNPAVGPPAPNPSPEPPLLRAVRAYSEGRPDQAIELLSAFDKPNQDLVLAILPVLDRGAKLDMKGDPAATAILADQLRSAAARIESRAALRLDAVTFCKTVRGYGRYDPWPKGKPYRPNEVAQLYIEVRNLVSQPTVGPHGETYLTQARETVEIRDAYGKLIDQLTSTGQYVPVVQDEKKLFTRTPIHEFHILYEFHVPSAPGVYTITLNIHDPVVRRSVKTEPIEFTVAGP